MICGLSYKRASEWRLRASQPPAHWPSRRRFRRWGSGQLDSTPMYDSSRMRNHHQRPRPPEHAIQGLPQALGIEGGEALVEHHELGALEQGAGDVEAALLAVRELPAGLSHHL